MAEKNNQWGKVPNVKKEVEELEAKPKQLQQESGIKSFLKEAIGKTGHEYSPKKKLIRSLLSSIMITIR